VWQRPRPGNPSPWTSFSRALVSTTRIVVGLVMVVMILVVVAIYAGAFIILAPMMQ
jgi:hypothetical protein